MSKISYTLLQQIWSENRGAIFFVYLLNILEELFYLFIPSAVGLLIDTFMAGEGYGIWAFAFVYLGWQGTAVYRQIMDTVIFTRLFNHYSLQVITDHQSKGIGTTKINARVELMNQVVQFFEWDLPFIVNSLISIVGSSALLYFYNPKLLIVSLIIIFPSLILNYFYAKRILVVTTQINDHYEHQIDAIDSKNESQQKRYFEKLRLLNIKRSNLEAINFGFLEVFVFLMIIISIYIICHTDGMNYGSIVASYGIILRFAYGFDFIPHTTTKLASIKDIIQRLGEAFADKK